MAKYNRYQNTYWDFHDWSIKNFENFWKEAWDYFGIITSTPYEEVFVKTGPDFLDFEWFCGAKMNYAENILKFRDDRVALIYEDEEGYSETVTFAEMFKEVELYAAAFRANGLKIGDIVACYMSNRKEAVYAYLATTSIGAIWGGPQAYYGMKAAAKIIRVMDAKFLIVVDRHVDYMEEHNFINHLPELVDSVPTLKKVIIVPTKEETYKMDISVVSNSCFLRDFLDSGRLPDGSVPDMVFEQLPPSHPISVSFSSGTTGLPKGPVHAAWTLVSHLAEIAFHWQLGEDDTLLNMYPMGWTLWNSFIPCLALGVKMVLVCGSPYCSPDRFNIWDVIAEHKVAYTFLVSSIVDRMEKVNILPSAGSNFDHLKVVHIGGSPIKPDNYNYIFDNIKEDVFIGSLYGATEAFGCFSGFDLNIPSYAGEVQAAALGKDVRCYDSEGKCVVGKRGEMVICTPSPGFPLHLWKDFDGNVLKSNYFKKFPGVWSQNDEIVINPQTKGIIVIGRSDDTLVQYGDRFGATDIYYAIHNMEEIQDYICVGQHKSDGDQRAVLFIKMRDGYGFTPEFKEKVEMRIDNELWTDCVPQLILETKDIPYNLNKKRMESVVRKIVNTNVIPEVGNVRNPESLQNFHDIPEVVSYINACQLIREVS